MRIILLTSLRSSLKLISKELQEEAGPSAAQSQVFSLRLCPNTSRDGDSPRSHVDTQSIPVALTDGRSVSQIRRILRRWGVLFIPHTITKQSWGIILSSHQDSNAEGSSAEPKRSPWKFSQTLFYTLFYPRKLKFSLQRMGNASLFSLPISMRNHPEWRKRQRAEIPPQCHHPSPTLMARMDAKG